VVVVEHLLNWSGLTVDVERVVGGKGAAGHGCDEKSVHRRCRYCHNKVCWKVS